MNRYVAFDLGAESGRVIVGTLQDGRMNLEVLHRFPNGPVQIGETLHWDVLGIHRELKTGLQAYGAKHGRELRSIGCDSWGVDFGLLDRNGALLGNPVHYRDARTDGIPERLFRNVPKKDVFRHTGIQIMQINTLYQLYSMQCSDSPLLPLAETLLPIADLQHYFFTGEKAAEFSLATTTQMYDPTRKEWATDMLQTLGLPVHILPDVIAPGTVLGTLRERIAQECGVRQAGVVAPACHDTASAVAAVPAVGEDWMYLSSGTWSLLGVEVAEPIIEDRSYQLNFTNEGGVDGTYRFLKNIMGLWGVQECKRQWEREGEAMDYNEIVAMAAAADPFHTRIDPGDESFLAPGGMPARIEAYCRERNRPVPPSKGSMIRSLFEGLAMVYRETIEQIESLTGRTYKTLHIVGGGSQNRLLNQFVADCTGKVVQAGPVEATAYGNCLMQAIALGDIGSLAEARAIVRASVACETFEPSADRAVWEERYAGFRGD